MATQARRDLIWIGSSTLLLACGLTACLSSPAFLKSPAGANLNDRTSIVKVDAGNAVVVRVSSDSNVQQVLAGPSGTDVAEASITFPPGSLAFSTEIRIEEANTMANSLTASELGLEGGFTQVAAAVMITATVAQDPVQPFTVALPLPKGASLLEDSLANLTVVYRVNSFKEGALVGVIPRDAIFVKNGHAETLAKYFGAYQAVIAEYKVTTAVQIVTVSPPVAKALVQQSPVSWTTVSSTAVAGRSGQFAATVTGLGDALHCVATLDKDGVAPWDLVKGSLTKPEITVDAPKDGDYMLRFECAGAAGRTSASPWSQALALTAVVAPAAAASPVAVPPTANAAGSGVNTCVTNPCSSGATSPTPPPPSLYFSKSNLDFGTIALGGSAVQGVQVYNPNNVAASITGIVGMNAPFMFLDDIYPGTGGNCGTTLGPGANCSLMFRAAGGSKGLSSQIAALTFNYGGGNLSAALSFSVNFDDPALLMISNGMAFDFGSVQVGSSLPYSFTLSNMQNVAATNISSAFAPGVFSFAGGVFPGSGGSCGSDLPGGSSCTMVVTAVPATNSLFNGSLVVMYNDGSASKMSSISLSVSGAGPAVLQVANLMTGTCVRFANGGVKCWGEGTYGANGNGTSSNIGMSSNSMGAALPSIDLGSGQHVVSIAAHLSNHVCALLLTGNVKCWGENAYGQLGQNNVINLGDDSSEMGNSLPPVNLVDGALATKIAVGGGSSCAILMNGTLKCWGQNSYGQLGLGDTSNRGTSGFNMAGLLAVNLGAMRSAKEVAVGMTHACAILDDDTLKCWGQNVAGALGQDNTTDSSMPLLVNLGGFYPIQVSAGNGFTCVILNNGSVKCWGQNSAGQLGTDDKVNFGSASSVLSVASSPPVNLGIGAASVVAGYNGACAVLVDGHVRCWGSGADGQLGQSSLSDLSGYGDAVVNIPPVNFGNTGLLVMNGGSVAMARHTCAVLQTGAVMCFGYNATGQLGRGNVDSYGGDTGDMQALVPVDLGM